MAEIDDQVLRVLFDTAVSSMDFGSGFLDDEEVACLRQVAEILGVDPMRATPDNFRCKYRGRHQAQAELGRQLFISFADGLWRNAYVSPDKAPGGHTESHGMSRITGLCVYMWCPDCGRRWEPFEDTTLRR